MFSVTNLYMSTYLRHNKNINKRKTAAPYGTTVTLLLDIFCSHVNAVFYIIYNDIALFENSFQNLMIFCDAYKVSFSLVGCGHLNYAPDIFRKLCYAVYLDRGYFAIYNLLDLSY